VATRILPEYRFPLHLEPSVEQVWTLYGEGKRARWEPSRSLEWARFDAARHSSESLAAASLVWSHRVWRLFGRLTESPALLVRYCLERDRESDPKYFLSMRCTEDAKHVDAAERMARACGGFLDRPDDDAYAHAFTQSLFRDALDAEQSLDAYVAAHIAWADGLDAALLRATHGVTSEPLAKRLVGFCLADRERQAAFGWMMLAQRSRSWTDTERVRIHERFGWVNQHLLASGVLTPWLARATAPRRIAQANAQASGLGGLDERAAHDAINAYASDARERFNTLGLELPSRD
jgi:hypothetical protein